MVVCLQHTLRASRLTERLLHRFAETGHDGVLERLEALNIQELPPILPITRAG